MEQLVTSGTVIGWLDGQSDFVIIHDGSFEVHCYVPSQIYVEIGMAFNVYKQNGTYYLGTQIRN